MGCIDETKQLLTNFPDIDEIYLYHIPDSKIDDTNSTILLLREIQIETDEEGNDDFFAINTELQLQIFFKRNFSSGFDMQQFQTKLLKLLVKNKYTVSSLGGAMYDPDTKQYTLTWYIEKESYLN
ncbi:DUF806 family protein [Ligilactobacillus sp. LYQ135]